MRTRAAAIGAGVFAVATLLALAADAPVPVLVAGVVLMNVCLAALLILTVK